MLIPELLIEGLDLYKNNTPTFLANQSWPPVRKTLTGSLEQA